MGKIEKIKIAGWTHDQWLQARKNSIGGSDAAAIVGLNDWSSPFSVWAEKTGNTPEKEDNERMRQGRDLESYVARRFSEETGKKVKTSPYIWKNEFYPWAHANVDRVIVGEKAGLECKTTSLLNKTDFKGGEYQPSYYVQCQHYMAVCGFRKMYLAVLVLNAGFYWFEIERNEEEIKALMDREQMFWRFIQTNTPPPPDSSMATTDALSHMFTPITGSSMELTGRTNLLMQRDTLSGLKKDCENQIAEIDNQLKLDMGDCEIASAGGWKVTWKQQVRTSYDLKALADDHPEINMDAYKNTTCSRVFKITKAKEKQ